MHDCSPAKSRARKRATRAHPRAQQRDADGFSDELEKNWRAATLPGMRWESADCFRALHWRGKHQRMRDESKRRRRRVHESAGERQFLTDGAGNLAVLFGRTGGDAVIRTEDVLFECGRRADGGRKIDVGLDDKTLERQRNSGEPQAPP